MIFAKRNTILFGAGAVIDWQGPKTNYVTECFVKSGFKARDNKTITSHIYEALINAGRTANFETILSVVEEFIIFFAGKKPTSAFLSLFFDENNLVSSFLNYSIYGNVDSHYSLIIPNDEASSSKTSNSKPPEQFFFELLLINLHTSIGALVSKYSFHSENKQDIIESSTNKALNDYFAKWIKKIKGSDSIVRLYTLNYDRLNKVILENRGIDVFEGFDSNVIIPYDTQIAPNIKRIFEDINCTCSFNLHGCCEWKLQLLNNEKNYLPLLKVGQQLAFNYSNYPIFETDYGKPGILTNIIAGYQKTQRSMLTPFKQMQYSFDRDCLFSDRIIIIGYSFNDEHINESIRMALIYNQNVKIHIVDCGFMDGLELKYFSEFANLMQNPRKNRLSDKVYSYGNTFAYLQTFKEFLTNEIEFF